MEFLSFLGGTALFIFSIVGAYPCLRWGLTGIAFLWRNRQAVDEYIKEDMRSLYRIDRG